MNGEKMDPSYLLTTLENLVYAPYSVDIVGGTQSRPFELLLNPERAASIQHGQYDKREAVCLLEQLLFQHTDYRRAQKAIELATKDNREKPNSMDLVIAQNSILGEIAQLRSRVLEWVNYPFAQDKQVDIVVQRHMDYS